MNNSSACCLLNTPPNFGGECATKAGCPICKWESEKSSTLRILRQYSNIFRREQQKQLHVHLPAWIFAPFRISLPQQPASGFEYQNAKKRERGSSVQSCVFSAAPLFAFLRKNKNREGVLNTPEKSNRWTQEKSEGYFIQQKPRLQPPKY